MSLNVVPGHYWTEIGANPRIDDIALSPDGRYLYARLTWQLSESKEHIAVSRVDVIAPGASPTSLYDGEIGLAAADYRQAPGGWLAVQSDRSIFMLQHEEESPTLELVHLVDEGDWAIAERISFKNYEGFPEDIACDASENVYACGNVAYVGMRIARWTFTAPAGRDITLTRWFEGFYDLQGEWDTEFFGVECPRITVSDEGTIFLGDGCYGEDVYAFVQDVSE